MTEVPYAVDAETSLTYDELQVLETQYIKEQAQGHITTQTKFNYAWGLVKSPQREHQQRSVKILQGLLMQYSEGEKPAYIKRKDIYRSEPTRRRECLYYLALGYYKLGDYENARKFNSQIPYACVPYTALTKLRIDLLIDKEPSNLQAQSLNALIDKAITRGSARSTSFTFHL